MNNKDDLENDLFDLEQQLNATFDTDERIDIENRIFEVKQQLRML